MLSVFEPIDFLQETFIQRGQGHLSLGTDQLPWMSEGFRVLLKDSKAVHMLADMVIKQKD